MIAENTLTGLGLFSLEIIHLISIGKKEKIAEIEQHFSNSDVVEYFQRNTLMSFG